MFGARIAVGLALAVGGLWSGSAGDRPPAKDRFLGKWVLPGEAQEVWEVHPDGTITGSVSGLPHYLKPTDQGIGTWLTYKLSEGGSGGAAVEFTVRSVLEDQSVARGVFKANLEFTPEGQVAVQFQRDAKAANRMVMPFPNGKRLSRPADPAK